MAIREKGSLGATAVVSRSPDLSGNYICDGTADEVQINEALAYVNALGGGRVILKQGTYNVAATITPLDNCVLEGQGRLVTSIVNTGAVDLVTVGEADCTIKNLTLDHSGGGTGACIVTNHADARVKVVNCNVTGMPAAVHSVEMVAGSLTALNTSFTAGDIDLSTASCVLELQYCEVEGGGIDLSGADHTLTMHYTRLADDAITAAAEARAHTLTLIQCDLNNQGVQSAATGGTTLNAYGCSYMGQLAHAGTGAWVCRDSDVGGVNFTSTGTLTLFGGDLGSITRAAASVVWWQDSATILVLPSGTATDGMIGYALAAASAVGGVTLRLRAGRFQEDNLTLIDDVNIIGEGHEICEVYEDSANPIMTAGADVVCALRGFKIYQDGTGTCLDITAATADVHCDFIDFDSDGTHAVNMTAGTFSAHLCDFQDGDIYLSTAACSLTIDYCRIAAASGIDTDATALAHTISCEYCDFNGSSITIDSTGVNSTVNLTLRYCSDIAVLTDASLAGTVMIEYSAITSATKSGTSPWVSRVSDLFFLSNTNATGAITCYGGLIYSITRAIGPIVWWQDTNTLKVIPCTTITDTIIGWAVAAASAGDTIIIHPGTYEEAVTLAAGKNLVGIDKEQCIINIDHATLITMAEGCYVANLTLDVTADSTANGIGIECNNIGCTIENLIIKLTRSDNTAIGISENTGTTAKSIYIRNCRITSGDSTTYGIQISQNGKTVYVEECYVDCDYALDSAGTGTIHTEHNSFDGATYSVQLTAAGTIKMHHDTMLGAINRTSGAITYKNACQQYEVWAGMLIGDAITAAAGDSPSPAAAVPYTVLMHPGEYDEVVTCQSHINLKGIGPKASVVIKQTDANVVILANPVELEGFTIRVVTPTGARSPIYDGSVACTVRMTDLALEITTPSNHAHNLIALLGAGDYTIERCYYNIGGTGVETGVYNVTNAATIRLIDNDFTITNVNAFHIWSAVAGTWTLKGNRWNGTCGMFHLTAGTFTIDNDALLATAVWGTMTGATLTIRHSEIIAPVEAGNLATIRLKNCSYRPIDRSGTGNIVDESPQLQDAPWKVHKWDWMTALANVDIGVRGTPADAGSGQVLLEVNTGGADFEAVETNTEVAGSLGNEFTPARTPRFITQIVVDNLHADARMFFGLRETLGDAVPDITGAGEQCAGFDWDGTNFRAISTNGAAAGVATNMAAPPSLNAQHQLEVIVLGGVQVEFYLDGVLVATHDTAAGIPTAALDWQHLLESPGVGTAADIDVTVRTGGCQECPS